MINYGLNVICMIVNADRLKITVQVSWMVFKPCRFDAAKFRQSHESLFF